MDFKLWLENSVRPMIYCDLDDTLVTTYNDAILTQLRSQVNTAKTKPLFAKLLPKYEAQLAVYEKAPVVRFPEENRIVIERPGCREFVGTLHSLGRLYLLSSGRQEYIEQVIQVLGLASFFDGLYSVKNGPPPPQPTDDNWSLIDDVVSSDKLTALGLDMKYDWIGDPDRETIEQAAEKHIIRIRPFAGDIQEPPGEFGRILAEIKSRLNG